MIPLPKLPPVLKGQRVAFIGPMGSGKTWSAEHLVKNYGYTRMSLAGKLKAIALEMYGITGKDGNDRLVLQALGTDLRKHDKDVWIKYLLTDIMLREYTGNYFKPVIDDVRYLNEAQILADNGFMLIRVVTPSNLMSGRISHLYPNRPAASLLHASETEQEGIIAEYSFINNEEGLATSLDEIMKSKVHA